MKKSLLGIAITTAMGVVAFSSMANAGVRLNGANLNGVVLNGVVLNGVVLNGTSLQGTANGIALHDIKVEGGQLVAVKRVVEK